MDVTRKDPASTVGTKEEEGLMDHGEKEKVTVNMRTTEYTNQGTKKTGDLRGDCPGKK